MMNYSRIIISGGFAVMLLSNFAFCDIGDFDTSRSTVSINDFSSGGPGKDGIPAISDPKFVSASKAQFLKADDLVIGLSRQGQAKAYPLRILNWHEIVNGTMLQQRAPSQWCH